MDLVVPIDYLQFALVIALTIASAAELKLHRSSRKAFCAATRLSQQPPSSGCTAAVWCLIDKGHGDIITMRKGEILGIRRYLAHHLLTAS
jgi:hypothetical protein